MRRPTATRVRLACDEPPSPHRARPRARPDSRRPRRWLSARRGWLRSERGRTGRCAALPPGSTVGLLLVGRLAGVPAWWIVTVARHGAGFAGASLGWAVGPLALAVLTLLCAGVVVVMPRLLTSPAATLTVVHCFLSLWWHSRGGAGAGHRRGG